MRRQTHSGASPTAVPPLWGARGMVRSGSPAGGAGRTAVDAPGPAIVGEREECTMMKLRSKILAGVGVVAVAGAVAATGLTVASAQAAGSSGTEFFQLVNTNPADNAPSSIIARGVFTAGG